MGIDLDYCDVEWLTLEMNQDHSVILGVEPSTVFWTLDDYQSYSISSMGFLPTVVDKTAISIKFDHSCPFQFADS